MYKEALIKGTLCTEINKGVIKLLPKEGDTSLIMNWRPITLLNVSYKIMAIIIEIRLVVILPCFVNNTQTGFIKGRYIIENLITSWEAMNWAKLIDQNVVMFLICFEKAYDRIE